ncbi:MAG: SDR family NAD(P)-dependent oxidoreductase [Desulfovibrionales bacterium]
MLLSGKTAVVTGSSRGLGKAAAVVLARAGCRVCLFSRTEEKLRQAASEIEAEGGSAFNFPGDVSKEEDVTNLRDMIREELQRLDILVNNAAVIGPPRFLEDADLTAWTETVSINLNGPYLCIRELLPLMPPGSSIINITSGLGSMHFPRFCAYSVTKAGIDQMTRSLSQEFEERGIRVNAVDPGVMDTPMQKTLRDMDDRKMGPVAEQFRSLKKMGSLRDPEEVARLILYLGSPVTSSVNGEILHVRDLPRLERMGEKVME